MIKQIPLYKLLQIRLKGDTRSVPVPTTVYFTVTYRCNHTCPYCITEGLSCDNELSYEEILNIIDQLSRTGVTKLILSGGEPFIRKDLINILNATTSRGFAVGIETNGTLITEKIARDLGRLTHIISVALTLRGSKPQIHDAITGVDGSFEKTIRIIRLLKNAGLQPKATITLSQENFHDADNIVALRESLHVDGAITFYLHPMHNGSTRSCAHRLTGSQISQITSRSWWKQDNYAWRLQMNGLCELGYDDPCIGADGKVFACNVSRIQIGDLRKQDFLSIWRDSPILQQIRTNFKREDYPCARCKYFCYCVACVGETNCTEGHIRDVSKWYCHATMHNSAVKKLVGDGK